MALTPGAIVAASLAILDEFGLPDLTMRRVASALDVKAGALYWHFGSKQVLLAAVADEILADLVLPGPHTSWDEWLRAWATSLRRRLLAHRDGAELVGSVRAMDLGQVDPTARGVEVLAAAGLGDDDAGATMQAFWHFVQGHVVEEQTRVQLADLGIVARPDPARADRHFDRGIGLFIGGTRALL